MKSNLLLPMVEPLDLHIFIFYHVSG